MDMDADKIWKRSPAEIQNVLVVKNTHLQISVRKFYYKLK